MDAWQRGDEASGGLVKSTHEATIEVRTSLEVKKAWSRPGQGLVKTTREEMIEVGTSLKVKRGQG